MKQKIRPSVVQAVFRRKLISLWPALKGSLAQVRKPCIRPACRACACGDKHPAYLLSFSENGRRRCMYVPRPLVSLLEQALKNGRLMEDLLYGMGPALIGEHRRNRSILKASKTAGTGTKSASSKKKSKSKS